MLTELSDTLQAAAETLQAGDAVIVVDDTGANDTGADGIGQERGRGFFLHAAALATPQVVNTAIRHGRGITCFSVTSEQAMRLGLTLAGEYRDDHRGPLFLRSVESADCDGTGISAEDRAQTLRAAGAPDAGISSLKSPGHVLPALIANGDASHAVADLAHNVLRTLSDHKVAAWTDILDDDGEVASAEWCCGLAARLGMPCARVSELYTGMR
ncbi:MAG TPA: 3,4-dihydroxy-2-butanone-4-phosphate synthase [Steroidobacteraceae bacterium]